MHNVGSNQAIAVPRPHCASLASRVPPLPLQALLHGMVTRRTTHLWLSGCYLQTGRRITPRLQQPAQSLWVIRRGRTQGREHPQWHWWRNGRSRRRSVDVGMSSNQIWLCAPCRCLRMTPSYQTSVHRRCSSGRDCVRLCECVDVCARFHDHKQHVHKDEHQERLPTNTL